MSGVGWAVVTTSDVARERYLSIVLARVCNPSYRVLRSSKNSARSSSKGPPSTVSTTRSIGRAVNLYSMRRPGRPAPVSQRSTFPLISSRIAPGARKKSMPPPAGGVSTTISSHAPASRYSASCSPAA